MPLVEDITGIRKRPPHDPHTPEFIFEDVRVPARFLGYVGWLETRMADLETELRALKSALQAPQLPDPAATRLITSFLQEAKAAGEKEVNAFEAADALRLPLDQTIRILKSLRSRGVKQVR